MSTIHPPVATLGGPHQTVSDAELDAFVARQFADLDVDGKKVVLVVPDGTRSCPLPLLVRTVHRHLIDRVGSLTAVIALAIKYTIGLRLSEEDEVEGIDFVAHGESAYDIHTSGGGSSSVLAAKTAPVTEGASA